MTLGRRDSFWTKLSITANPNPRSSAALALPSARKSPPSVVGHRVAKGGLLFLFSFASLFIIFVSSAYFFSGMHPCELPGGARICALAAPAPRGSSWPLERARDDQEWAALAVARDILRQPRIRSPNPKVAFLFLTPSSLPHELLWEEFFKGHEGMYSIFVHASKQANSTNIWKSPIFRDRQIPSKKVEWGKIDLIDAERRLLTHALLDADNEYFALLSDSCIPLQSFSYIYNHFINTSISYVDCFDDPGPHGAGRYVNRMLPEVRQVDFRKGAQWFALNRRHALLVVADTLYYNKFANFCKPQKEFRNCYPDEHYIQTFLHMMDPVGISNWSVTHVDWSERKWHPRTYHKEDITSSKLRAIQMIDESVHMTSDGKKTETRIPCMWNGRKKPCYLFARKFLPETTAPLITIYNNFTDM